jgi:putative Mg2+ transporter-C (MgtC) family protein
MLTDGSCPTLKRRPAYEQGAGLRFNSFFICPIQIFAWLPLDWIFILTLHFMLDLHEFFSRLMVALFAGFIIGFERQWHHKSAGLRTNTLVSIGSAMYVLISIFLTREQGDVTRIVGQVVTGVGFLCGGIIFKEGLNVHGLTTSATVWCCSAIGCMAASGLVKEALLSTGLVLVINFGLKFFDEWIPINKSKGPDTGKKA